MPHPCRLLLSCLIAALAVGCGDDPGPKKYTIPDVTLEPSTDVGGPRFGDGAVDDGADLDDGDALADAEPGTDAAAADGAEDTLADADDTAPDVAAPDTAPTVLSCGGHCGVFLEDNPCHCHHGCAAEGNCCADFASMCTCKGDADCDDGDDCTSDSCSQGFCKQIPFPNCCASDAACPAGNACQTAKCLTGSCTLLEKDCNDGIACTVDACDAATGACTNELQVGQCFVDGACRKAGDLDPASNGCAACDPAKDPNGWTPLPGKCAIDGQCLEGGAVNPLASCQICDTSKSSTAWTLKANHCVIAGVCYAKDEVNPANPDCEVCAPASSTSGWSGKGGKCAVDGQCYDAGTGAPGAVECTVCEPTKSASSFQVKAGFCLIDGACVPGGKSADGSFGCKLCQPLTNATGWTTKTGQTCDDQNGCTTATKCTAEGTCTGQLNAGCCLDDAACVGLVTPGPCEVVWCNPSDHKCGTKKQADCCASGQCCDLGSQTLKPAGSPCGIKKGVQYQCNGDVGESREVYDGCTGTNATTCNSVNPGYGAWTTYKTCGAGTTCVLSSPTSAPVCKAQ